MEYLSFIDMNNSIQENTATPSPIQNSEAENKSPNNSKRLLSILLIGVILILGAGIGSYYLLSSNNGYSQIVNNKILLSPEITKTVPATLIPSSGVSSSSAKPHAFVVKGSSMSPNYLEKQIWLYKPYSIDQPVRFDVIVFDNPVAIKNIISKRVIGLPYDRVTIKNGRVYINEQLLQEPYISTSTVTASTDLKSFITEGEEKVIPEKMYFVLGDNRPYSNDSRLWGTLSQEKIIGKLTQQIQSLPMPTPPDECPCLDRDNNICLPQIACL